MTPMLRQYLAIKEQYPETLLFFRLGDFYELFFTDAETAAPLLGVALTSRGHKSQGANIPMCGVPYHAAETYIAKVLKAGMSVAVCDQVESVEDAKKRGSTAVVKRDVVRVMTPGTVVEDAYLPSAKNNYLAAVYQEKQQWFVACIDVSTGEFFVEDCADGALENVFGRIRPKEVLLSVSEAQRDWLIKLVKSFQGYISIQPDAMFVYSKAQQDLKRLLGVAELDGFGHFSSGHVVAAGAVAQYIFLTHKKATLQKLRLTKKQTRDMVLDYATIASLELFETTRGVKKGSFFHHIDHTKTPGGQRMLVQDVLAPLTTKSLIDERLMCVQGCAQNDDACDAMRAQLAAMGDVERALARLNMGRGSPRDVGQIQVFLQRIPLLRNIVQKYGLQHKGCEKFFKSCDDFPQDLHDTLSRALEEELPVALGVAPVIAQGFDARLDALRRTQSGLDTRVQELEARYSAQTGVNVRIRTNNIAGHYIEVSKKQASKMPDMFVQTHTLVNSVRFSTQVLKELEHDVMQAKEAWRVYEAEVFMVLVQQVQEHVSCIKSLSAACSRLDVTLSHAALFQKGYVLPEIVETPVLEVSGGWHPVLKCMVPKGGFVPNDCVVPEGAFALITGPNMGGKSTFLRQNALIVLLAHMGAFVPATQARIGVVDRIFSRVGSSDDLTKGRSTFMVEMLETASILNQATERSFMILDEVGRGTSTHDGVALAWAITEYIHTTLKARCLFATHYHELALLERSLERFDNWRVSVREWSGGISFDYKIVQGFADRSYGLYVAKQAGMPADVVARAREVLSDLATPTEAVCPSAPPDAEQHNKTQILQLWAQSLNIDNMTPKQVFDLVHTLAQAKGV